MLGGTASDSTVTPMRSYTVVGLGAIGGYYGARLHQAGHPVRFLARSDADHVREHGLRVDSIDGDAVLEVDVYDDPSAVPTSDAVIVAVKTTATAEVLDLLASLVTPDGSVLVMQNGLGVDAHRGDRRARGVAVLGVMCFMCCNKVGPGHIHHLDQGAVAIGEHRADGSPAGLTAAAAAAVADLSAAGVSAEALDDLETGRWKKLVWNMAFNGLSVTEDAKTDRLVSDPEIRVRAIEIMAEVAEAAAAVRPRLRPVVRRPDGHHHRGHDALQAQHEARLRSRTRPGARHHLRRSHRRRPRRRRRHARLRHPPRPAPHP